MTPATTPKLLVERRADTERLFADPVNHATISSYPDLVVISCSLIPGTHRYLDLFPFGVLWLGGFTVHLLYLTAGWSCLIFCSSLFHYRYSAFRDANTSLSVTDLFFFGLDTLRTAWAGVFFVAQKLGELGHLVFIHGFQSIIEFTILG